MLRWPSLPCWLLLTVACGSSKPASAPAPGPAAPAADAAVPDGPAPDSGPSATLMAEPPYIFKFNAPPRVETWTMRYAGEEAVIDVESGTGTTRYVGHATLTDAGVQLAVATTTAKLSLDCKRGSRGIGATCNARKAPKLDVLDCFVTGFKEPMTFGVEPGVEYAAECNGYRRMP